MRGCGSTNYSCKTGEFEGGVQWFTSLTHKTHKKSWSESFTKTFKSAYLISLISAPLYERNLIKVSINIGSKLGPVSRHWFKDGPSLADEVS